jgi:hypothetical protein
MPRLLLRQAALQTLPYDVISYITGVVINQGCAKTSCVNQNETQEHLEPALIFALM